MPDFRLESESASLELPLGEVLIGRDPDCQIVIHDGLISRHHAKLHVTPMGVVLEDLGSRNGVYVNDERVAGRVALAVGDRVALGGRELRLATSGEATGRLRHTTREGPSTRMRTTLELPAIDGDADGDDETIHGTHATLVRLAEKALAMGKPQEASRLARPRLSGLLSGAREGTAVEEKELVEATGFALRLIEATGDRAWIDWVFDIHAALKRLPTAEQIEQLYDLARRSGYSESDSLREYLTVLRELGSPTPNQKFRIHRIEGLAKMVAP